MMKQHLSLYLILFASIAGLLTGCVVPEADSGPTPFPADFFPTVVVETAQAALATDQALFSNATPTETIEPTITFTSTNTFTPAPTITPTPSPSAPLAQIQIQTPGPMSKVTSPIALRLQVVSGGSELVQVDLQGEDGRLLARKLERVPSWPGGYYVLLKIPFEISTAAEVGRITVSTKDDFGRVQSLLGMHILLLSVGQAEINPPGELAERAVFYQPSVKDAVVSGGTLNIDGLFMPFNDQQVVLELIDQEDKTVGLRVLDFAGTDAQTFTTTVPYKVKEPTQARLVLRQDDQNMAGLIYLYSQEILLNP